MVFGQELIVGSVRGYQNTGDQFTKIWKNNGWNSEVDFAIYSWFKINSGFTYHDFFQGFQLTTNPDNIWSNCNILGDRVLAVYMKDSMIINGTYDQDRNIPSIDSDPIYYQSSDLDKWAFIYICYGSTKKQIYAYYQFASSGAKQTITYNIKHSTSNFYQIYAISSKYYQNIYFPGIFCSLSIIAGSNAYRESGFEAFQNLDPTIAVNSCQFFVIRFMDSTLYFQIILQICDQSGPTQPKNPLDVYVTSKALPALNQSLVGITSQNLRVNIKKYQIPVNTVIDLEVSAVLQSDATDQTPTTVIDDLNQLIQNKNLQTAFSSQGIKNLTNFGDFYKFAIFWTLATVTLLQIGLYLYGQRLDKKQLFYSVQPNLVQNSNNNQEFQQPQQNKHQKQDLQQEGMDLIQTSKKAQDMTLQNQFNQLALEKQVLSDNNNNNNIQLINLDQQDQQNVIQNEEKKLLLQQKQQNSKIDEINSISSEQSQQNLKLNKINNLSTKNEIGTTLKTITNIGAQSQLSLNLLQINQTIVIQNIQSQIKQQSPKISNQILDSKFQLKQEQKKEINNMNLGDIEFQNECIQNDNNNNNQTARSLQQNPQNEQIKDNQQNNQQDLQSQLKEKLNMLLKKQFLVRVLVFHEFFNIFYTFDPNMSRAIKFSIFYLRIVHSLCLTTIFDESYNINQKVMISIASSIILVTGVTIITKIHKIKFLGKKLSAFLMICLLLFYYYVILSIISGEDFQQANSKTISFLLIVSIDFLGMLTLMSILKLTIAFKTLNQVKEGGIFNIFEDVEKQEIDLLNSHLKRCEKIQSLKVNFGQSEIIMDLLRDLPFFKSLTRISFNLTNIPIQDEDFDFWILTQFLQKQKNIIELQIYLSQTKIGDSESSLLAEALSQMKKLSSLELFLDNSKISDIGVIEIIKGLKSISNNLKSLNIALNQTLISEEGIISVRAFLNNLKNLTSLILNFETTDKAAIQLVTPISGINQLQNLRLNLGGNLITDEGATHISSVLMSLKNLKALQLNLSQNQINAFGAVEIGNSLTHLQNLTSLELELWSNEIGLNGAQAIGTGLGSLNSLTNLQLYLGETKIQDEGAILLLEGIVGLKNLTKLSIVLWSNQIGNKGAQYLGNALKSLNQLKHLELNLLFSISQELIVGNLQNEFATTGQSFNKEWKNSGWNNYLGFAIYGWFKISSKQPISEWIVGFHFTSNDNSTWSNDQKYGDRVLCFFVKGNTIQIQTQTTPSSQIVNGQFDFNLNDMDKWAFIYVACSQTGNTFYYYLQFASSGVIQKQYQNVYHNPSTYYQIYVAHSQFNTYYFAGQICSLYLSAGPNAYTETETNIKQLFNIQPSIAFSCSFCQYMNLQLQYQFIVQICDQNGASAAQEPLDISFISSAVPSLSQTYSQFTKQILQINLKKYQIPFNSNLDIQINSTQTTNITCLQKLQNEWSSKNCQLVNYSLEGGQYCYCRGQNPTTITNDLKSLIQNKNLQTAFSSQGIKNISNFSYFYEYIVFWVLSSVTLIQIGLYLIGQRLDKKQIIHSILPEQIIQPANNNINNIKNNLQELDSLNQIKFKEQNKEESNINKEQQNQKLNDQNPGDDIEIVELDQLELKQENQQKQNDNNQPRQNIQISKQNEEIQQLDSLNNQMSEVNLQNQDKQQTNQLLGLANTNFDINTNFNFYTSNLFPQQQSQNLNQFQINNTNMKEPSIVKLEQKQTFLVNNLDKFNHQDQQKEELQIERLDQQSNSAVSIRQDQNINRKNNNIQQQPLDQIKSVEEEQKLKEQYIIDQNLQRLFQKSFAIKVILFHDFFNIFYTYDNKMSRGIRFNIFYLRTIHSLCLTTIFDDSYTIQQKILISIISSLILVTGELIVNSAQGYLTTGKGFYKNWQGNGWDTYLDFGIYCWFKINKQYNIDNWAQGFHFTSQTNQNWQNWKQLGDRVLAFYVQGNQIQNPTYDVKSNNANVINQIIYTIDDLDKWAFLYVAYGNTKQQQYAYYKFASSGIQVSLIQNIQHFTSNYYQINVISNPFYSYYFPGQVCGLYILAGPGAYRESGFENFQNMDQKVLLSCQFCQQNQYLLYNGTLYFTTKYETQKKIQIQASYSSSIYRYVDSYLYFKFIIEICNQNGVVELNDPLDIKPNISISSYPVILPSLQYINSSSVKRILEDKSNISQPTFIYKFQNISNNKNNLTCLQKQSSSWSQSNCQIVNNIEVNSFNCFCKDQTPTTIIDDLNQLIENKNLQTAFSSQGIKNLSGFGDFYKYAIFWTLAIITISQIGLFLYGQHLDKKQLFYSVEPIKSYNNKNKIFNEQRSIESKKTLKKEESIILKQQDTQIQYMQSQEQIAKQNEQTQNQKGTTMTTMAKIGAQSYLSLNLLQGNQSSRMPTIQQLQKQQISQTNSQLINPKLDQNYENEKESQSQQQQEEIAIQNKHNQDDKNQNEILHKQNLQNEQIEDNKQESQLISQTAFIKNLEILKAKPLLLRIIIFHEFFNIFYSYNPTISRAIRFNIFYLRIVHSLCLTTIFDESYNIQQKIMISIASSIILVTGVTIITNIHKIKAVGRKLSAFFMICLLLFYYYVILTIISGEDVYQANTKTLSFLMIAAIDFLGIITLLSILKLAIAFNSLKSTISQELIVGNLQNQFSTTGQSFHKNWSNNQWNNNLDFAIYGWFKISSQQPISDWIVGFHFTQNDSTWNNQINLGDRVLSFFIKGNLIQTPTYTTNNNQPNFQVPFYYNPNDLDKWAFIYVACTQSVNAMYSYFQFASSGVVKQLTQNVIHFTSNFYQIFVGYTKFYSYYFAGQICSLYLSAGSNAYTDDQTKIIIQDVPSPFYRYMNLQLQYQFIIQICDQNGASLIQGPLDISFISSAVPSLSQTYNQFSKSVIQINLKKYQIPFHSNLDIQFSKINSTQTNITCLQKLQNEWSSKNCQLMNYNQVGGQYCYCKGQNPTTITNDLKSLIQNKNLQTAFSSQGIKNISNFGYFYEYIIFWVLSSVTLIQIGLYLIGQRLDKKQSMLSIVPEQIIQPTNNIINISNNNLQLDSPNQIKIIKQNKEQNNINKQDFNIQKQQDMMQKQNISNKDNIQMRFESHFSQSPFMIPSLIQKNLPNQYQQQNKNVFQQNAENDIEIVELDQLEQKQENQQKQNESNKPRQSIQISKQNEEIQQLDSLNNEMSEANLQNQNKQQTNQSLEPSIVKLEQYQTSLVNNLDNFNHKNQQKDEQQIERLDQQSNCGISIGQDQNINRKNSNIQQSSLCQRKPEEEEQKLKEQYIIDQNLQRLFQKSFAIKIILFHDFFNIFYTFDNKMSRGIRFNIFYLRTIHSLCLTTIFDDSYTIQQKILISIFSSLILVTGVKIITLIHKIKIVGQKISLIILLSLLIFYYYVILSIISGEEASYANSKTISFVLILGIDFLGVLTLISILKLSLIYLSEKYQYSISQELIVGNLQNQQTTTGQSFHKDWSNSDWNNNLDFAIYGWYKLSSQQATADWIVGFHFTQNDNTTWSNGEKLGDRVLSFFIKGNYVETPTYTTYQNVPNVINSFTFNANDMDKWAFIYVACTQSGNSFYRYLYFASSGVFKLQVPNIIHFTSNFYQIYVGYTKYFPHYFTGQICSLYLSAGPNAYTENEIKIKQLFNIQTTIALSSDSNITEWKKISMLPSILQYMNLQLQYQFIVQICDQDGASAAQGPLDISFISKTVPSLSQTYNQFSKSIIQINLKKYQIPFNSNLDIQFSKINSTQTNITCLQKLQKEWSSKNCQLVNFKEVGGQYCYCNGQNPTTITNDLKSLIQNKNLQTAFSSQGIKNISNFGYFYEYIIFWVLSSVTLIQIGLYLIGQRLDKKQSMLSIVPEQIIQPTNNNINISNNNLQLDSPNKTKIKKQNKEELSNQKQQDMMQKQNIPNKDNIQVKFESHFSQSPFMIPSLIQKNLPNQQQQQSKNFFQQNAENDIEIVELDQLEQKQENQSKQNESNKSRQSIQIPKQNQEIQQLDSLNNEMSEANLQNTDKQQTNLQFALANTNSNMNTNINMYTINLNVQQNQYLNQIQINNTNMKEPSIVKLEQYQTSLVNNLDNFNHKKNQQKDEQQIERLDQQSNCGISIGQDQNINRKNSNIQQQSLGQIKSVEEEQKLTEQYIIDQNLQRLFQKSFAIKIILFHDFFNIFYTFDNKMSRGIRFNIFYLRTIHSLCLTTVFDDSYTIQQKILISIFSSLILVTGVKIITLIHKIKTIGQKLSLIILLSLLIFYYYVILSIISGEEASYANSKTISFVLILGIDFLGVLTLISILKLSLIYLSEKYQKKDNHIVTKLYNLLDLKFLLQSLAF
ncbi:hypothetical protein ABPG74_006735 [Tetrahymena malaccensis]